MQAILFALFAYVGWGTGDLFATVASRKVSPYVATFWFLLLQLIVYLPLGFFFLADLEKITFGLIILITVLALIGNIGVITFYEGVRIGNAALVGTISSSFIALTVILSIIFLGERINAIQTLAIVVIFVGLVISGLDFRKFSFKNILAKKEVLYGLVSMITWGIYWTFIKIPVQKIDWFWPQIIALCSFPSIYIYMFVKKISFQQTQFKKALFALFANAALVGFGSFSFFYAISKGSTSVVAPIAGSYPTLFAILALIIFRDKISKQQIFGIITTLAGIVLLAFNSV